MRAFTERRDETTPSEVWLVEHPSVFTLGQAGRREHVIDPGLIPVCPSDRGGQVTYHGPGQLVMYVLLDLRAFGVGVKWLVTTLEQVVIDYLAARGVDGQRRSGAPGVYVADAKVAALGLRVRRGCSYHGLAVNASMDLEPFGRIDPCGYRGLAVTQLLEQGIQTDIEPLGRALADSLAQYLRQHQPVPIGGEPSRDGMPP